MYRAAAMKKAKKIFYIGLVLILIWLPLYMLFLTAEELAEDVTIYIRDAGRLIATEQGQMATGAYVWMITIVLTLSFIVIFIAGRADLKNPEFEVDAKFIKLFHLKLRVPPILACVWLGIHFIVRLF